MKPSAVLFGGSSMGRDLAPRVAARLGLGLASDCTALAVEGGRIVATRPVYAGKAIQKVTFPKSPALVSLRPKRFATVQRRPRAVPAGSLGQGRTTKPSITGSRLS